MNGNSVKTRSRRRVGEREDRRRAILDAAEAVFSSGGYHEASLVQIAGRAGFAVGTIYLYFADKADLYGNVLLEKMKRLIETVSGALESSPDARECLTATIRAQFVFHDRNRRFFEIFLHQDQMPSSALHPKHWREMEALKRRFLQKIEQCITRGQQDGTIREGRPDLFAVGFLGITLQMIRQWIREKSSGHLADSAPFAAELFLGGAARPSPSL